MMDAREIKILMLKSLSPKAGIFCFLQKRLSSSVEGYLADGALFQNLNQRNSMKKTTILFCFIFLIPTWSYSQSVADSIRLKSFLFDRFVEGSVLLRSGETETAFLNYNSDDQSIVFIKNGQYLILTGLETVDTIYIGQRKFVPWGQAIYEVADSALLISYSNKTRPVASTSDHNGSSKQTANQVSNTVSETYVGRNFKGNYSVEIQKHYWLQRDGNLYPFSNKKQFLKIFPAKTRAAVEKYIDGNQVNFRDEQDLARLVHYCEQLG
jgi:hypothetical protein